MARKYVRLLLSYCDIEPCIWVCTTGMKYDMDRVLVPVSWLDMDVSLCQPWARKIWKCGREENCYVIRELELWVFIIPLKGLLGMGLLWLPVQVGKNIKSTICHKFRVQYPQFRTHRCHPQPRQCSPWPQMPVHPKISILTLLKITQ